MQEVSYFIRCGARNFISHRTKPLFKGVIVTDFCNLQCKHCTICDNKFGHIPFDKLKKCLQQLYRDGVRIIYLQGGEPFAWKDQADDLESIIHYAKSLGFFRIYVCTNGTYPLNTNADIIWLSIDGLRQRHNLIREDSFDAIMRNLTSSTHKNIIVQTTLNTSNYPDLSGLVQFVEVHPKLKGILFNFHVPYPGTEHLYIEEPLRSQVIDEIIDLKRKNAPIFNTMSALIDFKTNRWKRPLSTCLSATYQERSQCESARTDRRICEKCGYGATIEASEINKFNIPVMYKMAKMLFS
ncbi:MAG: radical SAM protein [Candidatus Omnitrophota bacterium]|nr:MAG: radical SAM protein [Candidatus Omnitrophota bacterium]